MSQLAFRTKVFARLLALVEKPVDLENTDLPKKRAARAKLQAGPIGRFVFGSVDPSVDVEEIQIDGRRALVYRPRGKVAPLPVVVNFHGGGWVQGNPEQSQWVASRLAARAGVVVVSPLYRLAPEDRYPAATDDAWATVVWVREHADTLGITPDRVAVMGDSAGGNLAAICALRARDEGVELRGQVLIYPGVEMYDRWPSEDEHAEAPVLTSVGMRAFTRLYLGEAYGTEAWDASPIRAASHADVAKALIVTAEVDPLRDNGRHYRDKLADAGVPVRYSEHPEAIHGFISLPGVVPVAAKALDEIVDFVRETV